MATHSKISNSTTVLVSFVIFTLLGCGEKENQQTENLPPQNLDLPIIDVPDVTEGVEATKVVSLDKKPFVKRKSEFAVMGTLHTTSEKFYSNMLRVRIMDRRTSKSNLVVDDQRARLEKISEGKYTYRAELKAPRQRGVYELHIKCDGKKIMKAKLVVR